MTADDREKYFMRWTTLARLYAAVDLLGKSYAEACGITDKEKSKVCREVYRWIENIERSDNAEKGTHDSKRQARGGGGVHRRVR